MAAFSYQHHHPFLLDSVFSPNTPIKLSGNFMEEGSFNPDFFFSQFHPPTKPLHHETPHPEGGECLDHHGSKVALNPTDNEPPSSTVTKKQTTESSTAVDKLESGEQVTQTVNHMDKKRKNRNGSSSNSALSKKQKKEKNKVAEEEPPKDYIHVRARRGQATDSHSLAERVRREKISERMKILQKLVPGCDKVTGKALMLDEIINYVQSLQNQVEFLSMKLASVNPMFYDFGMDLDTFMVIQRLNGIPSSPPPLPSVPQCSPSPSPTELTAFADATTTFPTAAAADSYPFLEDSATASASYLLHHQAPERPPDGFSQSQENNSLLWEMEDQKQRILHPFGFSNNLYCFH